MTPWRMPGQVRGLPDSEDEVKESSMSNRLALAALAAACIAAAEGGGYLATRQNAVSAPVAAQSPSPAVAVPDSTSTSPAPVQETEAVVGDNPKAATPGP